MNKLLLAPKSRNHIKIMPLYEVSLPETEKAQIEWCEDVYNDLESDCKAVKLFERRNVGKGVLISVWKLDDIYYIIECLRNEFKSYNTTIYLHKNENDSLNVAKFLAHNIATIGRDYKKQITDAKKLYRPNSIKVEDDENGTK